jgi:hypothetical protein
VWPPPRTTRHRVAVDLNAVESPKSILTWSSYIRFCDPNASLTSLAFWSHIGSNNFIILTVNYIGCIKITK